MEGPPLLALFGLFAYPTPIPAISQGEALFGTKLYGGGSTSITPLMDAWVHAYSFVRDDIGYQPSTAPARCGSYSTTLSLSLYVVWQDQLHPDRSKRGIDPVRQ
jgi:hypothetical protein